MKIEAMPSVMVSTYVPKIVKTKATQLAFLKGRTRKKSAMESSLPAPYVLMTDHGKDNALWFYVASVDGESLQYLMLLNPIKVVRPDGIKLKSVYQGSVWKSSYMGFIKPDLPSEVFWGLLAVRTALISDSIQSEQGKSFWQRRMHEALAKGLVVEALHFSDTNRFIVKEVVPITASTDTEVYWTYETEKDNYGLNWRFCIRKP